MSRIKIFLRFYLIFLALKCSDSANCGLSKVGETEFKKSNEIVPHSFPWFVAVQREKKDGLEFLCAGTLVSEQKVVTTAHCTTLSENLKRKVLLGVHNKDDETEIGRETFEISSSHRHPDYDRLSYFDANIAVLILDRKVKFNDFIQPICIFDSKLNVESIDKGVVIGYGEIDVDDKEEILLLSTPKLLVEPIVDNQKCLDDDDESGIDVARVFCGGWKNDTNTGNGDGGGGLYVKYQGALYLRGIVSAGKPFSYTIYTDVPKFTDWINSIAVN